MSQTASPGTCQRFLETMELFFQAIHRQSLDRVHEAIPDLESYIALRRDTSGCKPSWALIEYAHDLHIPDDVMDSPIIHSLGEAANDLVTWSNVSRMLYIGIDPVMRNTIFLTGRTSFRTTSNTPKGTRIT